MPRAERPLDSSDDVVVQFARDLRFLREKAGSPTYRELSARVHYSAASLSDAAGGRRLPSLSVALAYVAGCGGDIAEWEARWRRVAVELTAVKLDQSVADDGAAAPYVGLAAFQQEDADRFFGRDNLIADLMSRLTQRRFLAVFGPSGCGKSSLLRAGLAARLTTDRKPDDAPVVVFTPGCHPVEECAIHLARLLGESPGTLRDEFMADPRNLHLRIRQTAANSRADSDVVLVVDQFEELFTLCADEHERVAFVDALVIAATDLASHTRVVLGVRADFLGHCAQHPSLVAVLRDTQVLVGPMTTEELRLAIIGPAQQAGSRVETALVARLVADAGTQPGMLPLVSHALLQTWQRRQGPVLTLAAYNTVGGIEHALTRTAEQTYQALDADQQHIAQQIFLRLTALGEGTADTKRRVAHDELDHDNPNTVLVLVALTRARLITVGHNSVEIAHEALIQYWPRLRDWLTDDRDGHRLHRQLTDATTEWEGNHRDHGLLYRGARLTVWHDRPLDRLNNTERAFLTASRRAAKRERTARIRRLRWSLAAMGVVMVVISLLAGLAVMQTSRASEERDIAFSRQLAASARTQLQVDPELALLLAIKAVEIAPTAEADAALRQAVVDHRALATVSTGHGQTSGVAISPNGRQIATSGEDGTVRIWARQDGPWQVREVLQGQGPWSGSPAFSPDGRYLAATTGQEDSVQIWDLRQGGRPLGFDSCAEFNEPYFNEVKFSPDGGHLAAATSSGVCLWDLTGAHQPVHFDTIADRTGPVGNADDVEFSADGRYLASSGNGMIFVWDRTGQQETVVLSGPLGRVQHLAYTADGQRLVSGDSDGHLRIWTPSGGGDPAVLGDHGAIVSELVNSNKNAVISSGFDGVIRLTDVGGRADPVLLRGHRGPVMDIALSQNGKYLASVGIDGTLRLWSTSGPTDGMIVPSQEGGSQVATFTPDGTHVLTGNKDGTIRTWRIGDDATVVVCQEKAEVSDLAVSPDGRAVASIVYAGADGVNVYDSRTGTRRYKLGGNSFMFSQVEFGRDDQHVVTTGRTGVRLWGPLGKEDVLSKRDYTDALMDVSQDGTRIAVDSLDTDVYLWQTDDLRQPEAIRGQPVTSLALSPDGRTLATGGDDGTVRIWQTAQLEWATILRGHVGVVSAVAFAPDGQHLITAGRDRTIRIWHLGTNADPVVYEGYRSPATTAAYSPDGNQLLITQEDGTVQVQQCDVCRSSTQTLALAKGRTTRQLTAEERATFAVP